MRVKAGWYACKTLLACDPDVNRRSVYFTDGDKHSYAVIEFNRDMKPWTADHENNLQRLLQLLNATAARPGYWKANVEKS